jgi:hypothetical protein
MTNTRSWEKPCPAIRFSELAITAFWEITTPFDLPVVPVVYRQKSEDQDSPRRGIGRVKWPLPPPSPVGREPECDNKSPFKGYLEGLFFILSYSSR